MLSISRFRFNCTRKKRYLVLCLSYILMFTVMIWQQTNVSDFTFRYTIKESLKKLAWERNYEASNSRGQSVNSCDVLMPIMWTTYDKTINITTGSISWKNGRFNLPEESSKWNLSLYSIPPEEFDVSLLKTLRTEGINIQPGGSFYQNQKFNDVSHVDTSDTARHIRFYSTPCTSRERVAIIVPYRNRAVNLAMFLAYMHRFLPLQRRSYKIFVLEQVGENLFNRAKLFNALLRELGLNSCPTKTVNQTFQSFCPESPYHSSEYFHCFAFHDVDKLPIRLDLLYACGKGAVQSVRTAVSPHNDRIPKGNFEEWNNGLETKYFPDYFGGVTFINRWSLQIVNGASNSFYGWGGEDDDLLLRLQVTGQLVEKRTYDQGKYYIMDHENDSNRNKDAEEMLKPELVKQRLQNDGLIQVNYRLIQRIVRPLYTLYRLRV